MCGATWPMRHPTTMAATSSSARRCSRRPRRGPPIRSRPRSCARPQSWGPAATSVTSAYTGSWAAWSRCRLPSARVGLRRCQTTRFESPVPETSPVSSRSWSGAHPRSPRRHSTSRAVVRTASRWTTTPARSPPPFNRLAHQWARRRPRPSRFRCPTTRRCATTSGRASSTRDAPCGCWASVRPCSPRSCDRPPRGMRRCSQAQASRSRGAVLWVAGSAQSTHLVG